MSEQATAIALRRAIDRTQEEYTRLCGEQFHNPPENAEVSGQIMLSEVYIYETMKILLVDAPNGDAAHQFHLWMGGTNGLMETFASAFDSWFLHLQLGKTGKEVYEDYQDHRTAIKTNTESPGAKRRKERLEKAQADKLKAHTPEECRAAMSTTTKFCEIWFELERDRLPLYLKTVTAKLIYGEDSAESKKESENYDKALIGRADKMRQFLHTCDVLAITQIYETVSYIVRKGDDLAGAIHKEAHTLFEVCVKGGDDVHNASEAPNLDTLLSMLAGAGRR